MIRIVALIIMCSMAFCAGTVYVSYGSEATANLTYDGSTNDTSMDTAPITLGFLIQYIWMLQEKLKVL